MPSTLEAIVLTLMENKYILGAQKVILNSMCILK